MFEKAKLCVDTAFFKRRKMRIDDDIMPNNISYSVKAGDTLYKLAQQYHTTVEALIKSNPNIDFRNIPIGSKINIPVNNPNPEPPAFSSEELKNTLRELWKQLANWTRMAIMSILSNNPGYSQTQARLLRIAVDMANALKPFYGDVDSTKLADLIKQHLTYVLQLANAVKTNDSNLVASTEKELYTNASAIANFLFLINPFVDVENLKNLLNGYLTLTEAEITSRVNGDFEREIVLFDQIESQVTQIADALASAIEKQFVRA